MTRVSVDTGGTFTDIVAEHEGQRVHLKLPSTPHSPEQAVAEGVEALSRQWDLSPTEVLHGTTVGTNALLERRGARVVLITNEGLEDVLALRRQNRPDLYALHPELPPALVPFEDIVGIPGRLTPTGEELEALPPVESFVQANAKRLEQATAFAICLLHSYANPRHEEQLSAALTKAWPDVPQTVSHRLVPLSREFERTETSVANAFITPVIARYLQALLPALRPASVSIMSSSGGLLPVQRAVREPILTALSGPAGGVLGARAVGQRCQRHKLLSLDMGGTSTDISVLIGVPQPEDEGRVGPHHLRTPLLPIETIGAGGGSIAFVDEADALQVGPRSAGAVPGPAAYGRAGPDAHATVTDAHAVLGRLDSLLGGSFPLHREAARAAVQRLATRLHCSVEETAQGIIDITNASIARACKRATMQRGCDPRELTLVAFGGAGGLHACALADELGCKDVLFPAEPGLLSAEGILSAPRESRAITSHHLPEAQWATGPTLQRLLEDALLQAETHFNTDFTPLKPASLSSDVYLDLRYQGQTYTLPLRLSRLADTDTLHQQRAWLENAGATLGALVRDTFANQHHKRYGYALAEGHTTELVSLRAFVRRFPPPAPDTPDAPNNDQRWQGPASVPTYSATLWLPAHWEARQLPGGDILCERREEAPRQEWADNALPLALEVHRQRLASIAEEMGAALMRASFSANIKERRDFSCALFNHRGQMLAHAAHIPVHLGSQSLSVQAALDALPMTPDMSVILNDPYQGGTHLPDVTLIKPLFTGGTEAPSFFASNRAHHADVGGITPGSIPAPIDLQGAPRALTIEDEGIRLPPLVLSDEVRERFANASRTPEERRGDLRAQEAANHVAEVRLNELHQTCGEATLTRLNDALLDYTEQKMRALLCRVPDGVYTFTDYLDDGDGTGAPVPIPVTLTIADERATVDFRAAPDALPSSLNAVRAITIAAVFYVFRCLGDSTLPANEGLLRPFTILTRPGSLCDAREPAAVSAGNVETSQRMVDSLLGALRQALPGQIPAASAGTMNNVLFGGSLPKGPEGQARNFVHYETLAAGAGASTQQPGADGIHTHMTNTLNTPIEELERLFPVRIRRYQLRRCATPPHTQHRGGYGVIRTYEFLRECVVTVVSERRALRPPGIEGGAPGLPGRNTLLPKEGAARDLGGKACVQISPGDRLQIETPGGGHCGEETA